MPTIYDNIEKHLELGLNKTLEKSKRADFCIGYFNLRGWKQVSDSIEKIEGGYLPEEFDDDTKYYSRVLIGMQKFPQDEIIEFLSNNTINNLDNQNAILLKKKIAQEFKEQLEIGTPTNNDENTLKKLSTQLKEGKVIIKLHLKHTLHAKLYLVHRDDFNTPTVGFVGSSNLTFSGISKQGELNVDVVEGDAAIKLSNWFQDRWEDRWSIDITKELAEIIDNSWATEKLFSPYHIYLKIAYHLSSEARAGISEFNLPRVFKNVLLQYQESAVKVAARYLYHRNGVIIGDVVGLGKTFTATALAKIFKDDFSLETLIICPKNLQEMWDDYSHKYQLGAKVLSITQVQTALPKRKYRLLIIDESHNLRNREGKRYKVIQEYIRLNDCKVILLTATPYNKTYLDLSNQLRLFLDPEKNIGISPDKYIENIGGITKFRANHQVPENSIGAFEKSEFADDWAELMRLFLVRRTRSFIKNNYGKTDKINGRRYLEFPNGDKSYFPDRLPKKVEYQFDKNDPNDQYAQLYSPTVINIIDNLILPRYGLGQQKYAKQNSNSTLTKQEILITQNLSRAGTRLIGFARTNLFKRLESSGHSFLLSISKHIMRNYLFIYAFNNKLPFPIGKQEAGILNNFMFTDNDGDEGENNTNLFLNPKQYLQQAEKYYNSLENNEHKYDWIRSELFNNSLKNNLINDSKELLKILELGKDWKQENDRQLNALYNLIETKHNTEKILIFTQFSDTAYYLFNALKKRNVQKIECVTGAYENPTQAAYRFSPVSNKKDISKAQQIRVLLTTDVLSEGQNLQDAHIVLNYDLPWAIIRLIQRAGRVDRIGQKSKKILVYSFLPEDGIEDIINLRGRLKQRIKENAETVGSDEVFFEGDPINIKDLYNEKANILDDEEDMDVDLSSFAYQIWKNATDANPELLKIIPNLSNSIFATKKADEKQTQNTAVVYTKTAYNNDILAWINTEQKIISKSQTEILKALRCNILEKPLERFTEHNKMIEIAVNHIRENEDKIGGQLGTKRTARYKAYTRLDNYINNYPNSLWITDVLKKAVQDILDYPLREYASDAINRQLKNGITDEDFITLITSLREDQKLSIITDKTMNKEPKIICSMGLKI